MPLSCQNSAALTYLRDGASPDDPTSKCMTIMFHCTPASQVFWSVVPKSGNGHAARPLLQPLAASAAVTKKQKNHLPPQPPTAQHG